MADDSAFAHLEPQTDGADAFAHLEPQTDGKQAEQPFSWRQEAAHVLGKTEKGMEATLEAPEYLANWGARQFGFREPFTPPDYAATIKGIIDRINGTGTPPGQPFVPPQGTLVPPPAQTMAGRYAGAVGEQIGANVIPAAGLMGTLARAGVAPAEQLAGYLTSSAGAGVSGEAAKEAGVGPAGQAVAQVIGGVGAPMAGALALRSGETMAQAARYGQEATANAANPHEYALQKVADAGVRAGVDWDAARDAIVPQPSPALQARFAAQRQAQGVTGMTPEQIAAEDREFTADIVSRRLAGEAAADIARDYNLHPTTVNRYVENFQTNNPTPMNLMDAATDQLNEGGAQPLTRLGRAAVGLSDDPLGPQRLMERQAEQPGRAAAIIQEATADAELQRRLQYAQTPAQRRQVTAQFEQERNNGTALETTQAEVGARVQAQARAQYTALHAQPDIVADENLANVLSDPMARTHWDKAAMLAGSEGDRMPNYDEMTRAFGQQPRPGLGLNRETGEPQAPPQYPVAPPGPPLVQPGMLVPVKGLDYFQRALRLDAQQGGTTGYALNAIRQRVIDAVDPLAPGFRQTMQSYRTGRADVDAMTAGENLVSMAGARPRETLREFNAMTPDQQHLFRLGFSRALMDKLGKAPGANVASQFLGRNARATINRVFDVPTGRTVTNDAGARVPETAASRMIRGLEREDITSRTKNEVLAGSRTAPMLSDMEKLGQAGETAANVATMRFGALASNLANRLKYQIGERQATEMARTLTESDPAAFLRNLSGITRYARSSAQRQQYATQLGRQIMPRMPIAPAPVILGARPEQNKPRSVKEWRAMSGQR